MSSNKTKTECILPFPVIDTQALPEDAFHSQDVLSRHLVQQQEDDREGRSAEKSHGRDGADVEYINVDESRSKPQSDRGSKEVDCKSLTLKTAQSVMKTTCKIMFP